jgi:hypothetical protein
MIVDSRVDSIRTREDFVAFAESLARDVEHRADDWENLEVHSFLAAIAHWVDDMDGYFSNVGEPLPDQPTWKTFAQILAAALVYE